MGCGKKFKHLSGGGNPLLTEPVLCTRGSTYIFSLSSHKATPILQMDTTSHAARMWHNWNSFQARLAKGHCGWNLYSRNEAEGQILRHKIQSHTNTIFFHFTRNYPSVSFKLPACYSFVSPFLWAKGSTSFRFLQRPPSSGSYDRAALVAQR